VSLLQQRRQEEKEARRESIIDAAEAVFSARGFEGATMADIAEQARLSRALVYVYFKDKEELMLAITLRGLQLLRRSFERAVAKANTGLAKVEAIGRAYIEFGRTQPDYFQPIARAETKPTAVNSELEEACQREGAKLCRITADAVRTGIEDGSIDSSISDPDAYAFVLWGLVHGIVQVATAKACTLEKSYGFEVDEIADKAIALIQRGIARR
jgi:AcrR family transcriptional regulator